VVIRLSGFHLYQGKSTNTFPTCWNRIALVTDSTVD
jgi:hypothetical protein